MSSLAEKFELYLDHRVKSLDGAAADTIEPATPAIAKAGNYKKGHAVIYGLPVTIETAAGQIRRGKDWQQEMQHHYGYIKKTESEADKDHIDVFINPDHDYKNDNECLIFIINQVKSDTGAFDEHKCMIGFELPREAIEAYHVNYSSGWKGYGSIAAMQLPEFKEWIKNGDTSKPVITKW